jgi:beta-barrel assembly-enhancing protease
MRKEIILGLLSFFLAFPKIVIAIDEKEIRFGNYQNTFLTSTQTFVFNESLNRRISEIGNKISKACDKSQNIKYTFRIINDPTINAYAAAGGFIYVNTGLLDILDSEDELAAVLAHEIAHVNESHQIKWVNAQHRAKVALQTASIVLMVGGAAAGAAASVAVSTASAAASASAQITSYAASWAAQTAVQTIGGATAGAIVASSIKGYGKNRELEADDLAIKYTQKAGYDPTALISVFNKFIKIRDQLNLNEKNYASSLINAEPGLDERIKTAEELISKTKK